MADKLLELAKKEYEELIKQKTELQTQVAVIDKKVKPLIAYLQAMGAIRSSKRGRKPKAAADAKA